MAPELSPPRRSQGYIPVSDSLGVSVGKLSFFSLDYEVLQFYDFVRPLDFEESVRKNVIERIQTAVSLSTQPLVNRAQIKCFGSFAADVYLPTADMDLVAVSAQYLTHGKKSIGMTNTQIRNFGGHLIAAGVTLKKDASFVLHAKVPIVKFTERVTGLKVDVSFENDSGLKANVTFQRWKQEYPAMPVLVIVIKQLLAMRGHNEVHSGGLGGFSIICLVVYFLSQIAGPSSVDMNGEPRYGVLLMNFLQYFGDKFNVEKTGLAMDPPHSFDKSLYPGRFAQRNTRLTIIDPNRPENDISGGTANINLILNCFDDARAKLLGRFERVEAGDDVDGSILECVLGGNYSSFTDQRNRLYELHAHGDIYDPARAPPLQKSHQQPTNAFQRKKSGQTQQGWHQDPPAKTHKPANQGQQNGQPSKKNM